MEGWGNTYRCGAARGRPAVLLHGFMGCGADWAAAADGLGSTHRCLAPDLPGHGASTLPPSSMTDVVDALAVALDSEGIERTDMIGYSMGGRIALCFALAYPKRVRRLVIESASPGISDADRKAHRAHQDDMLARKLERMDGDDAAFRAFLESWYRNPLFGGLQERSVYGPLLESRLSNDPVRLASALRALTVGRQPDCWERLTELPMATLVIVGAQDRKYRQLAERMMEASAQIAVEEMTGCGHSVHVENPDGYTTCLRSFLAADGSRRTPSPSPRDHV